MSEVIMGGPIKREMRMKSDEFHSYKIPPTEGKIKILRPRGIAAQLERGAERWSRIK